MLVYIKMLFNGIGNSQEHTKFKLESLFFQFSHLNAYFKLNNSLHVCLMATVTLAAY